MRRINVVGTSGSGKTSFARELTDILGVPCYEMDALFWKPHWQELCDEEFIPRIRDVTSGDAWVLDGNYTRAAPEKWSSVQLVIWLDLSFPRTVFRVTKRAILRSFTQQEIWTGTGNRESLGRAFLLTDSIIWWAITSYRRNRKRYSAIATSQDYANIRFVRLRGPAQISSFLAGLRRMTADRASPGTRSP